MITGPDMHRRALAALRDLESRVKSGEATDADRERYRAGCEHVLIYEWAGDPAPTVELILREPEPEPERAPEAVAFADWYERARRLPRFSNLYWYEAARWWWGDKPPEGLDALWLDMNEELNDRGLHWSDPAQSEAA